MYCWPVFMKIDKFGVMLLEYVFPWNIDYRSTLRITLEVFFRILWQILRGNFFWDSSQTVKLVSKCLNILEFWSQFYRLTYLRNYGCVIEIKNSKIGFWDSEVRAFTTREKSGQYQRSSSKQKARHPGLATPVRYHNSSSFELIRGKVEQKVMPQTPCQ